MAYRVIPLKNEWETKHGAARHARDKALLEDLERKIAWEYAEKAYTFAQLTGLRVRTK